MRPIPVASAFAANSGSFFAAGLFAAAFALSPPAPASVQQSACDAVALPADAIGNLQYLSDGGELLAWREWTSGTGSCIQLDWPEARRLSQEEANSLRLHLAVADGCRRALVGPALPRAQVERGAHSHLPAWLPLDQVLAPVVPRLPGQSRPGDRGGCRGPQGRAFARRLGIHELSGGLGARRRLRLTQSKAEFTATHLMTAQSAESSTGTSTSPLP